MRAPLDSRRSARIRSRRVSNKVNELLDHLDAVLWRLYELPIAFLVLCALAAGLAAWFLVRAALKRRGLALPWTAAGLVVVVCLELVQALANDRRNLMLQREMIQLRENGAAAGGGGAGLGKPTNAGAFDPATPAQSLPACFRTLASDWKAPFAWKWWQLDDGTDYFRISFSNPLAVAHLAIVDLDASDFEVVLPRDVARKTLTSVFARREGAVVAVNGEAGRSQAPFAKLGEWKGNYIVQGVPVYLDDNDELPFLSFDRSSTGRYFPAAVVDKANAPGKYNTIWGRFDLLVGGKLQLDPRDDSRAMLYSRTILGINASGGYVYLLVVDGKCPGYSLGLTMEQCGRILLAMGCTDAMACDQGGSSCMYVKGLGVASRPSDGYERPVYTHFGIRHKEGGAGPGPSAAAAAARP